MPEEAKEDLKVFKKRSIEGVNSPSMTKGKGRMVNEEADENSTQAIFDQIFHQINCATEKKTLSRI
jgi:hypothetical protein